MLSRVKIDKAIVLLVTILIVLLGVIALRFFTEDNTNKYTKVKEPEVQISRENEVKVQEIIEAKNEEVAEEHDEDLHRAGDAQHAKKSQGLALRRFL